MEILAILFLIFIPQISPTLPPPVWIMKVLLSVVHMDWSIRYRFTLCCKDTRGDNNNYLMYYTGTTLSKLVDIINACNLHQGTHPIHLILCVIPDM